MEPRALEVAMSQACARTYKSNGRGVLERPRAESAAAGPPSPSTPWGCRFRKHGGPESETQT